MSQRDPTVCQVFDFKHHFAYQRPHLNIQLRRDNSALTFKCNKQATKSNGGPAFEPRYNRAIIKSTAHI